MSHSVIHGTLDMEFIETSREVYEPEVHGTATVMSEVEETPADTNEKAPKKSPEKSYVMYKVTGYYDYVLRPYPIFPDKPLAKITDPVKEIIIPEPVLLQDGDLLRVFNKIMDGEYLWSRRLMLASSPVNGHLGHDKTIAPELWQTMFNLNLPAVHCYGPQISGRLEFYVATGEAYNTFLRYNRDGYEAMVRVEDGVDLTIFKKVTDGHVFYDDHLGFNALNAQEKLGQPYDFFGDVMRRPKGLGPKAFMRKYPAILKRPSTN